MVKLSWEHHYLDCAISEDNDCLSSFKSFVGYLLLRSSSIFLRQTRPSSPRILSILLNGCMESNNSVPASAQEILLGSSLKAYKHSIYPLKTSTSPVLCMSSIDCHPLNSALLAVRIRRAAVIAGQTRAPGNTSNGSSSSLIR